MRLSHDKVNKLAALTTSALAEMKEVEFLEAYDDVRQELRKILETLLHEEELLDKAAKLKIENQKRTILEGSQEWDILYRKYYNEEVQKLGIKSKS